MSANGNPYVLARKIREARQLRKEGIAHTTRMYNYQINVLIVLAVRELYRSGYNEEVRAIVQGLAKVQKTGYFDHDNS